MGLRVLGYPPNLVHTYVELKKITERFSDECV